MAGVGSPNYKRKHTEVQEHNHFVWYTTSVSCGSFSRLGIVGLAKMGAGGVAFLAAWFLGASVIMGRTRCESGAPLSQTLGKDCVTVDSCGDSRS